MSQIFSVVIWSFLAETCQPFGCFSLEGRQGATLPFVFLLHSGLGFWNQVPATRDPGGDHGVMGHAWAREQDSAI